MEEARALAVPPRGGGLVPVRRLRTGEIDARERLPLLRLLYRMELGRIPDEGREPPRPPLGAGR